MKIRAGRGWLRGIKELYEPRARKVDGAAALLLHAMALINLQRPEPLFDTGNFTKEETGGRERAGKMNAFKLRSIFNVGKLRLTKIHRPS